MRVGWLAFRAALDIAHARDDVVADSPRCARHCVRSSTNLQGRAALRALARASGDDVGEDAAAVEEEVVLEAACAEERRLDEQLAVAEGAIGRDRARGRAERGRAR